MGLISNVDIFIVRENHKIATTEANRGIGLNTVMILYDCYY